MAGLPKIVRDRLGRTPGDASGVDHPDANLLAGFVERSLTSRERSLVLGHLAQCAECREQVSVALPKLEAEMAGAGAGVARGWLRWPALRWGLLVASLVIMGTVALVRQPPARSPRRQLASRANVAPASLPPDVTVGAAPGKAARPASPQETALPKGKSQNDELALSRKAAPEKAALGRRQEVPPQLKQEVQSSVASLPSKAPIAASVPGEALPTNPNAFIGGSSNQTSNAVVAEAAPPPAAPKSAVLSQEQPMSVGDAVGGAAQAPAPAAVSRQLVGATPKPRQASLAKKAPTPAASAAGSNTNATIPMTADWSISASGKVQRSRDGRKSWEELDVDRNVVFRVVFAVGPDVWLGGSKGALYHSTDGGQHWTRVNITTGSTTVADDVLHIEFKDAQRGTVGTAAGETWTTLDVGQHWQKQ